MRPKLKPFSPGQPAFPAYCSSRSFAGGPDYLIGRCCLSLSFASLYLPRKTHQFQQWAEQTVRLSWRWSGTSLYPYTVLLFQPSLAGVSETWAWLKFCSSNPVSVDCAVKRAFCDSQEVPTDGTGSVKSVQAREVCWYSIDWCWWRNRLCDAAFPGK